MISSPEGDNFLESHPNCRQTTNHCGIPLEILPQIPTLLEFNPQRSIRLKLLLKLRLVPFKCT